MASWWIVNKDKATILTPKVASRSISVALKSFRKEQHQPQRVSIWVRHPIERIASSMVAFIKKDKDISTFLAQDRVNDHLAPMVDYLNWRFSGGVGDHNLIDVGAKDLIFKPERVFFYEDLPQSYFDMCEWLDIDRRRLKWLNEQRKGKTIKDVFLKNLNEVEKYYSNDLIVYERLKKDYGSN